MNIHLKQLIDRILGVALIVPNVILARWLGILLRRDHSLKNPPNAILVIKILGIGSMVMASDAIAGIRKQYPNAHLILLCNQNLINGIKPAGLFDEY